jgi:hypothetical protein
MKNDLKIGAKLVDFLVKKEFLFFESIMRNLKTNIYFKLTQNIVKTLV